MSTIPIDAVELRTRGFEVLSDSLGWVNAVRFVQQFEISRLNYTAERDAILPQRDVHELVRMLETPNQKSGGSGNT